MPDSTAALQQSNGLAAGLSAWVNEGDAVVERETEDDGEPPLGQAELKQLRVRVVALESVVLALLTAASEPQRKLVAQMARRIAPRAGATAHRVTLHAADEIAGLLERSKRLNRVRR